MFILPTAGRRTQAADDRPTVQTLIAKLVDRLKEESGDNLVSVVFHDSVARGDYRLDSDIHLLIFEELPRGQFARRDMVSWLERDVERQVPQGMEEWQYHAVTTVRKTREEARYAARYYLDMTTDAVILYDKDHSFSGVLHRRGPG